MPDLLSRLSLLGIGGHLEPARPLGRSASVTVVIPVYNYGRYLRQCVASVTEHQPGVDVEIIIVDDKSTDDSLDIAQALASKDARIKIIQHHTNKRAIATYNDGLEAATGEFVALLSADDLLTPGALTRAAALLLAKSSVGMVYGHAIRFSSELPSPRTTGTEWIVWPGADWLRTRCRSGFNVISSPEVVMRTSILRAIGGYRPDLPHAGDFEMWLRTAAVSDIGFLVGVDQAYYRDHAVNMNKEMFKSGTAQGKLIDLKQRWQSFEAVFSGAGRDLPEKESLIRTARRTVARHALDHANYAYARGFHDFPIDEYERFAYEIDADAQNTRAGRALARRKRLGMTSLPLHPLWAPSAAALRFSELVRRWRRRKIGV
ncbi:glycosyltransferase [Microvirga terricola]|uniref:Glycosyltransferase n=1 Tax=Microvirga terricola TaxID=2719797 RepID=A0ABX0V8W1_9HYPH|nr:glycosyltransferase [Microvirga terricola]NIX75686.1 glycosyltransferase [Microvirga terricola]